MAVPAAPRSTISQGRRCIRGLTEIWLLGLHNGGETEPLSLFTLRHCRGQGLARGCRNASLVPTGVPAMTQPRAARFGLGLRGEWAQTVRLSCCAHEASPRLTAPDGARSLASCLPKASTHDRQLLGLNPAPPPHTPHSHPLLFTKHFPLCDLICCS